MKLIDDRGDHWMICLTGHDLVRQVDSAACQMIRERHTRPVKVVMSLAELERAMMENGSGMRGCHPAGYSIAGIPVEIQDDRYVEDRYVEQARFGGIDLARPGSERTVMYSGGRGHGKSTVLRTLADVYAREAVEQGLIPSPAAHPIRRVNPYSVHPRPEHNGPAMSEAEELTRYGTTVRRFEVSAAEADAIYRRHGGTKRPPSKLHPLVQLDEAIGRDMTKGDE